MADNMTTTSRAVCLNRIGTSFCKLCADNAPREYDEKLGWIHPVAPGGKYVDCCFQEQTDRKGDWIQTWTGRQFFARDPRPEDFHILDIAAGMRNPRYSNQCILSETVGEHSVKMWAVAKARGLSARHRRGALLHDGSEAILIDVPRPIKRDMPDYTEIEDGIMRALAARFDFNWPIAPEIKELDNAILNDEFAQNMAPPPAPWRQLAGGPLGVAIECWSSERAFILWLHAAAVERLI